MFEDIGLTGGYTKARRVHFFGNLRYTKDDQKQGRNKVFQRENIKMIK